MYQKKFIKIDICRRVNKLFLLRKTQDKSGLVYYRFHNTRNDTSLNNGKPQIKLKRNVPDVQ